MKILSNLKKCLLLIGATILLGGCNSNSSVYYIPESGYTTVNHIDNLAFCVPSFVANKATAITKISNDQEYDSNIAYSYKNGTDEYIMFCINQLVVLAQKGTSFQFLNTENKETCLTNSDLLNTWFTKCGKSFSYTDEINSNTYKIISDVTAEVVITTQLYGDFVGKLAVISDGTDEWSVFAGVMGNSFENLTNEQQSFINDIVLSMRLEKNPIEEVPTYDVVLESNPLEESKDELLEKPVIETNATASTKSEIEVTTQTNENLTTEYSAIVSSDSDFSEIDTISENIGINVTNQKRKELLFDNAYKSDEYSMLSLCECGILSARNSKGVIETPIIRINKIYTGKEAKKIVNNSSNEFLIHGFEAPRGYTWHVAEYDVSYESCSEDIYINIKIEGLDGNKLYFRGIPCEERTYDSSYAVSTDSAGNSTNHYVFYAVPNGCKEYVLKCGEGSPSKDNTLLAAYYLIQY